VLSSSAVRNTLIKDYNKFKFKKLNFKVYYIILPMIISWLDGSYLLVKYIYNCTKQLCGRESETYCVHCSIFRPTYCY